jgi:glucan biosynthesis protein C
MPATQRFTHLADFSTRHDFLDWLRVIAILVLLFYHTGMLFVGWWWHIQNAETIPMLVWPMEIAHRLRMPLLFVIAGAGIWFALKRRSAGQFAAERSWRTRSGYHIPGGHP